MFILLLSQEPEDDTHVLEPDICFARFRCTFRACGVFFCFLVMWAAVKNNRKDKKRAHAAYVSSVAFILLNMSIRVDVFLGVFV